MNNDNNEATVNNDNNEAAVKRMFKLFRAASEDAQHDLETYNGYPWHFEEWVEVSGDGPLCSSAQLHCYSSPLAAELYDPCQGNYGPTALLYVVEVSGKETIAPGDTKRGYPKMRVLKEQVERRHLTIEQRIEIAIRVAAEANKIEL